MGDTTLRFGFPTMLHQEICEEIEQRVGLWRQAVRSVSSCWQSRRWYGCR